MSSKLDLKGKLLKIATNLSPPYVFMNYDPISCEWKLTAGVEVKLLQALSKHFNFTYQVIDCDNDWGVYISANHSWTGIMGAIVSKEADLGFAGLTVTEERSRFVYFTDPHIITSVSFITPPPKNKPKVTLVIEPFEPLVWVSIFVSIFLMFSIGEVIIRKWVQFRKLHIKWGFISVLLKQTLCCRPPNLIPLRLLMYFWLLACLVLTASYSGCLYSLMAVPSKVQPINELTELAAEQKRGRIQVVAIGSSSYFECLKAANFGVYKELGELLKPIRNKEEGLKVVVNGNKPHAYISSRDHLVYGFLRFGSKSIYLPPAKEESTVFVDVMAIAMSLDFKHKIIFNKIISDLKNGGFLDYWKITENRKLMKNGELFPKTNASPSYRRRHRSLRLDQLQSALYLFVLGQTLAIIALFIEIIYEKHRKSSQIKVTNN